MRILPQARAALTFTEELLQEQRRAVTRLQQELLTLAADMRELERRGEDKQREAGEQQRLMQVFFTSILGLFYLHNRPLLTLMHVTGGKSSPGGA